MGHKNEETKNCMQKKWPNTETILKQQQRLMDMKVEKHFQDKLDFQKYSREEYSELIY